MIEDKLIEAGIEYCLIFLNRELYNKNIHKKNIYLIEDFYSNYDKLLNFFKSILINISIFKKSLINDLHFLKKKKVERISFQILFLNSKFLFNALNNQSCIKNLITHKTKQAIFFKAEGFEIKNLILSLKKEKIKTIAIQHGFVAESSKFCNLIVDEYWVWSKFFKDILQKQNNNLKIIISGNPSYDNLFKISKENKTDDNLNLIFLPNSGKSETTLENVKFSIEMCTKFFANQSKYTLYIKPHPGGDNDLVKDIIGNANSDNVKFLEKNKKINLRNYKIILTMNSTVGLESSIFKKPLIILLSSKESLIVDEYIKENIALLATDENQLKTAFTKVINEYKSFENSCNNFKNKYLSFQGNSSNRIISLITSNV